MACGNRFFLFLACHIVGFSHQIGQLWKAGGNFFLTARHANSLFHQERHRRPVKGLQLLLHGFHPDKP